MKLTSRADVDRTIRIDPRNYEARFTPMGNMVVIFYGYGEPDIEYRTKPNVNSKELGELLWDAVERMWTPKIRVKGLATFTAKGTRTTTIVEVEHWERA